MIVLFLLFISGSAFGRDYDYFQPEQIHLAFGEKSNDIVVTWSTFNDTDSTVEYGFDVMDAVAHGDSSLFREPDQGNEQFIHRVLLPDLKFNTSYVYHCGCKTKGWSEKFSFKTPHEGENWVVRAAIYGDMGNENARSLPYLQDDAERGMYDLILHVGDMAYDMHELGGTVGDLFMRQIQPLAAILPYMTCVGNHEESSNFTQYRSRFSMPNYKDTESLFYSFNLGPVHFVAISTEVYYFLHYGMKLLTNQYEWLKEDLIEANKPENREKRPWIILFGHRPMYCSNSDDVDCSFEYTRKGLPGLHLFSLEPLLRDYGVDVVIWAHEHSYERTWPLYDTKVYNGTKSAYVNPGAPVHVVTGSAGCREHTDGFKPHRPEWSAFRNSDYGYTKFWAYNHTHLYMEQVSVEHEKVIDSFWIEQHTHATFSHLPPLAGGSITD